MSYYALKKMKERNREDYNSEGTVNIPPIPEAKQNYGKEALAFIRECCENLNFDVSTSQRAELKDSDGKSSGKNQIPYNMERDIERLSFEKAIGRFLASGSREDAFDIYYCYCEIFKPFGAGYDSAGLLLELLSEHEVNASSLLMKHRDHYSHSAYVFLIGLAVYKNHKGFRDEYNVQYGLADGPEAACHFLQYWGLASLFHDIGYPFEIAHQQMKAYVCKLDKNNNDDFGFAPYVSYRNMDEFTFSRLGDLNELFSKAIIERLGKSYLSRTGTEPYYAQYNLTKVLKDRGIHENPNEKDYLYMDHAYFSGLMMMKTYLRRNTGIDSYEKIPVPVMDAFCAIILHNSLFKFIMRSFLHTKEPFGLYDGQPLAYLLMLCDELQCWDRTSYGQNSRGGIFAFDFDMDFTDSGMHWKYYFDKTYEEKAVNAKAYKDMLCSGYTKKSGAVRKDRSKFVDDIDEIISLKDMVPTFESDVKKPDTSQVISVSIVEKKKKTGLYLSDSNYLSLYEFALALHGRYAGAETPDEMKKAFEEDLSLEYKLSNIAQAKGFAAQLEAIDCFYTDRAVDYEPVINFTDGELLEISKLEHERWCSEKLAMGWQYGNAHVGKLNGKNDNIIRERTRQHHDICPFDELSEWEIEKDSEAMKKMLELIEKFGGLTVYRMK